MTLKPFIKWAGGKRWLIADPNFRPPSFTGRYIEPFLGGGAIFFHLLPRKSILSDLNERLIETYQVIRDEPNRVLELLQEMQRKHSKPFYYEERSRKRRSRHGRAAQFLYLNRTCWNGLYRENLKGEFNVPKGTKSQIVFADEDFLTISNALQSAELKVCDFEDTINDARCGDFVFADPPYTTAHNMNGFIKYNQQIFRWEDQLRLRDALTQAFERGANIVLTNADHVSIRKLYLDCAQCISIGRPSIISGKTSGRRSTSEVLFLMDPQTKSTRKCKGTTS